METSNNRKKAEVADVLDEYGSEYLKTHRLCPDQQKAFQAIVNCRTSFMGGHLQECNQCGHKRPVYNSCRNRHCPKCQYIKQVQWVENGTAPEKVVLTKTDDKNEAMSRPVFPYPQKAVYDGKGDPNKESSFNKSTTNNKR